MAGEANLVKHLQLSHFHIVFRFIDLGLDSLSSTSLSPRSPSLSVFLSAESISDGLTACNPSGLLQTLFNV